MHKSTRERKPNSLLNNDHVFWRKRFEKPELMQSYEEKELKYRKFVPSLKLITSSDDKDDESQLSRKRLYHEITGKQPPAHSFNCEALNKLTLHELPTSNNQINYRFEENKNSYLNIFGYNPNTLEPQNKFSGYNKLEA